jgi:hypothetical protein
MRRQHGSPFPLDAAEPADVIRRGAEPLDVHDVRCERVQATHRTMDARHVLEPLQDEARAGARSASKDTSAQRCEHVVTAIAVHLRLRPEQVRRRKHVDVMAAASERRGEGVVVRRREARRIEERDAHQRLREKTTGAARMNTAKRKK